MRTWILTLALLAPHVASAERARELRTAPLRLTFLPADDASVYQGALGNGTVDVGILRAKHCRGSGCMRTVAVRRFRLRIDGGSASSRFVRVYAFLTDDVPGQRIRLDGRLLTAAPLLVDASAPLRVAISHTLEIEVATSQPAGVIGESVQFTVEDSP